MFCAISLVFSIVNTMLFTLTQSPIFFYATICLIGIPVVLAFFDEHIEKIITRVLLLLSLCAAMWYSYQYGRYVLGVDWEIIVTQSSLLVLALGISCFPNCGREAKIV